MNKQLSLSQLVIGVGVKESSSRLEKIASQYKKPQLSLSDMVNGYASDYGLEKTAGFSFKDIFKNPNFKDNSKKTKFNHDINEQGEVVPKEVPPKKKKIDGYDLKLDQQIEAELKNPELIELSERGKFDKFINSIADEVDAKQMQGFKPYEVKTPISAALKNKVDEYSQKLKNKGAQQVPAGHEGIIPDFTKADPIKDNLTKSVNKYKNKAFGSDAEPLKMDSQGRVIVDNIPVKKSVKDYKAMLRRGMEKETNRKRGHYEINTDKEYPSVKRKYVAPEDRVDYGDINNEKLDLKWANHGYSGDLAPYEQGVRLSNPTLSSLAKGKGAKVEDIKPFAPTGEGAIKYNGPHDMKKAEKEHAKSAQAYHEQIKKEEAAHEAYLKSLGKNHIDLRTKKS